MTNGAIRRAPRWFWLVAFLPPLWSAPGRIAADTKTYLSLDPSGLLRQATSLWEADTGLGTVTHQTIGYLFPQGPWWWLADLIGLPDWITQRLWWSTLIAVALFGAHRLARTLTPRVDARAATITALAYGFSPYLFAYISRISAILLPWAVLPWLVLALRSGVTDTRRWRAPARVALLVLVAGTVNATSVAFVVAGAVVWLIAELGSVRRAWPVVWRSAVTSVAVSVWWLVALVVQGANGIDILRFTETYETIMRTAMPSELLRGFGYWFSYGGDWLDPWVEATYGLLAQPWYLALGLLLALGSLIGLTMIDAPARRPAAVLVVVGLAFAIGEAWTGSTSPWGLLFGAAVDAGPGMVLRSTQRAVPLLALGLAFGLGALSVTPPRLGRVARGPVIIAAIVLQSLPWWTGGIATDAITRGSIPADWTAVAAVVGDDVDHRVWETPGADFASYRWGGTIDPVLVGLTDRSVVARELIPLGTDGAADLVSEVERRIAENTLDPAAIAPIARLMAADTIVARNDLEFERYGLARPDDVTERIDASPDTNRVMTGESTLPDAALIDEQTYGGVPGIGVVPAVAVWSVDDPMPVLSIRSGNPIVVHGSAATLVALAEQGLIDGSEIIIDGDATSDLPADAWTVLGDSNRREDRRWYSVGSTLGATRAAGEVTDDPSLQSLNVVADDDRYSLSELTGGFTAVSASGYGSPAILSGEDRPEHGVDGDPFTAWRAAALESTEGVWFEAQLASVAAPAWVDLVQPLTGERDRWITQARVTTDGPSGKWSTVVDLGDASRALPGQRVILSGASIESIRIEVLADSTGPLPGYGRSPGVGFAEVTLDGVDPSTEWVVLPDDERAPDVDGRTTVLLDRRRLDPSTANRFDPEPLLARSVDLAVDATMTVTGSWSPSAHGDDPMIRASSPALVGVGPVWVSEFDPMEPWVEVEVDRATSSLLNLELGVGELYSSVGSVVASDANGHAITAVPDDDGRVVIDVSAFDGDVVRLGFADITARTTVDRFSDESRTLPVAVIAASPLVATSSFAVGTCVDGLLEVDGVAVSIRLNAEGTLTGCDAISLDAGRHRIRSVAGHVSGVDLNRVVLDSGAGRASTTVRDLAMDRSDTTIRSVINTADAGEWLIVAESWSAGWRASIDGVDLGAPVIVDAYAMGWRIPSGLTGSVLIEWQPQRAVSVALLAGLFSAVVMVLLARRRGVVASLPVVVASRRRGVVTAALLLVALGPWALAAPVITPFTRRGRRWLLAVPVAAMWLWTSVRQVRWDMPVDLDWPSSMGWAQGVIIAIVAACCWVALTED